MDFNKSLLLSFPPPAAMAFSNREKKIILFNLYTLDTFSDQADFQTCNSNQSLIFEQNETVVITAASEHWL